MRFFRRSLTGLMLLAVTLALLGFAAHLLLSASRKAAEAGSAGRPQQERVIAANVVKITPGQIEPVLTAFGEIRAQRSLEIRAPRAGSILWVSENFKDGAEVAAGALILRFDPADAAAELALAGADLDARAADLAEAKAAISLATDDLAAAVRQAQLRDQAMARQEDLAARGVGSAAAVETAALAASGAEQAVLTRRQALQRAKADVQSAAASLQRQRITHAEAERRLAETEVLAEFSGRVDAASVAVGGTVGTNEVLGRIIDSTALEVAFRLSTAQYSLMLDAQGTLIRAPLTVSIGPGSPVTEGRVDRVGAAVGEGQTGRLIYATLGAAEGLRPGDFVTVELREPVLEAAAMLPATALGPGGVLVLGAEDRLEEMAVIALRRQGDEVIIAAAALAGREVVRERSTLLGAGIRITPVRSSAGAVADAEAEVGALTPPSPDSGG